MKKILVVLWILSIVGMFSGVQAQEKEKTGPLNILYIEQSGYNHDEMQMLKKMFTELSGIEVNLNAVNYQEAYPKISASAATYDVIALDQIWLADFIAKGLLAPLDRSATRKMGNDIAPAVMKAFQAQKQTWAFPYLVNFQMLFYNHKMLTSAKIQTPPQSLDELVDQMKTLKKQGIVEYPWTDSWAKSESVLNDYVWLTGAFGGNLFDAEGNPVFDQEPGVKALQFMRQLLTEQLADPSILTNDELAAKDIFLSGKAAFTSNWVFLSGLVDDPSVSDIVGQGTIALLPSGETTVKTASVAGLQGVSITAASQNKEAAWKWIEFFTSPLVQRAFLVETPIWTSVQTSPDVNLLDPLMAIKRQQLEHVIPRPNIANYAAISAVLQKYLHLALEGKAEPSDALAQAKTEIIKSEK